MTTATKSKPTAVGEVRLDFVKADDILREHDPDTPFSWEETEVLKRAGIIDTIDINRETGRIAVVNETMASCPPRREREASQVALVKAKSERNQALPDLEAKRAKIDAEIAKLNATVDKAQDAVRRDAQVVDRLRQVAPRFIREEYEIRLASDTHSLRMRRSELQTVLEQIATLSDTSAYDQASLLHAESMGLTHMIKKRSVGTRLHVDEGEWIRYVERRRGERPELLAELDKVESELAAVTRECEKTLNYYVEQVD